MEIREATVHFYNDTPHPLHLRALELARGIWGEASPPATIDPHAFASWDSRSRRRSATTEGSVEYRVDDERVVDDLSAARIERPPSVRLSWCNPGLGTPEGGHQLLADDFAVLGLASMRDYVLGVAFTQSDTPPITGWVETVFGLPTPAMNVIAALAQMPHAHLWYRIRKLPFEEQAAELVADLRDAPGLVARPVVGASAQAWFGTWASSLSREPAIDVRIDRHGPGRFDVEGVERHFGEVFRAASVRVSPERSRAYQADLWTHPARGRGPVLVGAPLLGHVDRAARALRGMRRANAALAEAVREGEHGFAAPLGTWARAIGGGIADATGLSRWSGPPADTLRISAERRLMLYGVYTPDRQLVRHQIRYQRSAANGAVLLDVMLAEYLPIR
jgi:hypothetical protein